MMSLFLQVFNFQARFITLVINAGEDENIDD